MTPNPRDQPESPTPDPGSTRQRRAPEKDRTSLVISLVLHVALIGGVAFWAYKTGRLEKIRQVVLQYVKSEKKVEKKPEPVQQRQQPPPKLPPINQGVATPPPSSGTRRAVAADAPEAAGGSSFFQDTRKQVGGPSSSASAPASRPAPVRVVVPPPAPVRPAFKPTAATTIKALLMERAKEVASTESFGSEQISKTGVSDAGAIIGKVSGATIVEGKFAVIRGLSDRYVTTTFNGGEIPSADPYRRSASLDLFPAQLIDKIVVSKTFTPDQQGTFTGGGINIVSKSFPERSFMTLSSGLAYNPQSTGNEDFLSYRGGDLDWLGMDDGTRAIPASLADTSVGLPSRPSNTGGGPNSPSYAPNLAQANRLADLTREMGVTQFGPHKESPSVNHNFSLAAGDTAYLFRKPFGVFGSLNYKRDFNFYEQGISRRFIPSAGGFAIGKDYHDSLATDVVNWSALVSLAYQLHPDHDLAFNYLYNQNGQDYVRKQQGFQENNPGATFHQNRLQFTERTLSTYQLKGTDRFSALADAKLEWLAVMSETSQYEPDVRFFNYLEDGGTYATSVNSLPEPSDPTRYYRNLDEQNLNLKIDLSIPFRQWSFLEGQLKFGVFDSTSERTFSERQIYYPDIIGFDGNPNNYLTPQNLGYVGAPLRNGGLRFDWQRYIQSWDTTYNAESTFQAAYWMVDFPVSSKVRLVGGMRAETTEMQVDSKSYAENALTGKRENSSALEQTDILPAAGLIWSARTNLSMRLNYSQTIARPSFREVAAYRSYDPVLDSLLDGNPNLKMSSIKNYDLRWDWYPTPGELISVSFYYKDLQNAIEQRFVDLVGDIVTFENRPTATVLGFEMEARKSLQFISPLLSSWSIGGNFSYIQSEVELSANEYANKIQYVPTAQQTRALYDQSPIIMNLDLNYDNRYTGTSASLILNASSPRISIASLTTEDIYDHPPLTLDVVFAQKIGRKQSLKVTVKNILNPPIKRTYGEDSELRYSQYKRGTTYGLSWSYDF